MDNLMDFEDLIKDYKLTAEEEAEMRFDKEIIETAIKDREKVDMECA